MKYLKLYESYMMNYSIFEIIDNFSWTEISRFIKENTDKINDQNKFGNTALHIVTQREQGGLVKMLLKNNADPNIKNDKGETPIMLTKSYSILCDLIIYGANWNVYVDGVFFADRFISPFNEFIIEFIEKNRPSEYKKYLKIKKFNL
jgi:hypothetical protein